MRREFFSKTADKRGRSSRNKIVEPTTAEDPPPEITSLQQNSRGRPPSPPLRLLKDRLVLAFHCALRSSPLVRLLVRLIARDTVMFLDLAN